MSKRAVGHSPKTIQSVFVLLLLSLFAVLSTFLVTVGAQLYRNTVESAEKNNALRIVTTVLRSTIWGEDSAWAEDGSVGRIEVETFRRGDEEVQALSIIRQYGSTKENVWVKRVFVYDGYLREGYNEYYKKIRRKDLKAGQRYLEADQDEDAEYEEDDELWDDLDSEDGDAGSGGMFEEAADAGSVKYAGYQTASRDGGNGDGDGNDYVYVLRGFSPAEDGEPLCELIRFEPSREENGMLSVLLETVDHQTSTVRMHMRTGGAE